MKTCGVAVAMLLGQSWAPTPSNGPRVNVGTTLLVPPRCPARVVGGKVRCRLMPVGWGGGPVVVRGRESRPHGEGVQRACLVDLECQEPLVNTRDPPLRWRALGIRDDGATARAAGHGDCDGLVESRMRWKSHVRFGGRAGETHQPRGWQGAPVRPLLLPEPGPRQGASGRQTGRMALGWLPDGSEAEVRAALAAAIPEVVIEDLVVLPRHAASNPLWWASSAFVNDELVAKFAWSEIRAVRLHREGILLRRLNNHAPGLQLPDLVALHEDPVLVVTHKLDGQPLSWGAGSNLEGQRFGSVASQLAEFLTTLHSVPVEDACTGLAQVTPTAQADTARLRARYGRLVDEERARLVDVWCDWVDEVLATSPAHVVVHGDLHGYNQLWDFEHGALVAVLDLEECGPGDRHFDFRYLPGNSATTALLLAVAEEYERLSGVTLDLERIMAWHILTVLGDALWRTEAGVELPGGGNARSYVDEVQDRLETFDIAAQ